MADLEVDPWALFLKLQESWSKGGHAARDMVTVYSVTFF